MCKAFIVGEFRIIPSESNDRSFCYIVVPVKYFSFENQFTHDYELIVKFNQTDDLSNFHTNLTAEIIQQSKGCVQDLKETDIVMLSSKPIL